MVDADEQSEHMYYRMMGNTGIQVSVLFYLGHVWHQRQIVRQRRGQDGKGIDENRQKCRSELLRSCRGIRQPNGEAERIFGIALKDLQEEDPHLWRLT